MSIPALFFVPNGGFITTVSKYPSHLKEVLEIKHFDGVMLMVYTESALIKVTVDLFLCEKYENAFLISKTDFIMSSGNKFLVLGHLIGYLLRMFRR